MGTVLGGAARKPATSGAPCASWSAALWPYRGSIAVVLVFAIASTAAAIVGPKMLGAATTALFNGVVAGLGGAGMAIDLAYIGRILVQVGALYIVSAIFAYVQGWIMAGVSMKVTYRFRRDIGEKINRMPLRYFDGTNHGEVLSRITNDVDTISQTLNQSLMQTITAVTTVVGVLIMMLSINVLMTLVALLIVPLSMVFMGFVIKRSQKYFRQQQDYLGHVNGHVEEMYGGHLVMKAFNGEEGSIAKLDEYNAVLYGAAWKSQFFSGIIMPIMQFIGNLGYVAVCVLGGWLAVRGVVTVGDIQAFIQYVRSFTQPMTQFAQISNVLQQTAAAAERVFEFLAEPEEVAETAQPLAARDRGRARSSSATSTSATARTRSSSTTSPPRSSRARGSPSSARRARARPRWSSS